MDVRSQTCVDRLERTTARGRTPQWLRPYPGPRVIPASFKRVRQYLQTPNRINVDVMLLKCQSDNLPTIEPPKTIVPDLKGGLHPARLFKSSLPCYDLDQSDLRAKGCADSSAYQWW